MISYKIQVSPWMDVKLLGFLKLELFMKATKLLNLDFCLFFIIAYPLALVWMQKFSYTTGNKGDWR